MKDNRIKEIISLIPINKDILDIGCAQNPEIYEALAKKNTKIIGIDIDKKKTQKMQDKGHRVYLMNAENIKLNHKFDYIVAGEIIEHLSNPGLFIESARKHLKDRGKIIITTPNISSIFLYILVVVFDQTQDPTHTFYFDKKNLEVLIGRFGLQIISVKYVPPAIKFHGRGIIFKTIFFIVTIIANIGYFFSQRLFGSYLLLTIKRKDE